MTGEIRLLTFELSDIGLLAVDYERARRQRRVTLDALRKARREYYANGGERWLPPSGPYEDEKVDPEYTEATESLYQAYKSAAKETGVKRMRLTRAIAKFDSKPGAPA